MRSNKDSEIVPVPPAALQLLIMVLSQMAKGNAVTIIPVHAELTTQEAADLLNVSRPFLVGLLEERKIPFRRVGSRRRVLAKDILLYKEEIDKKRLDVLQELANEAQQHNMGY
jgi:excisionase family DNA binding protein